MTEPTPAEGGLLEAVLGHVDRALDGMLATVHQLGDERVNSPTGLPGGNTAFQLVRHCCGVLEFWGGHVFADRPIERDRAAEFESAGSVADLVELVGVHRTRFREDLTGFDGPADPVGTLRERDLDRDELRTQAGILLHVYEELAQHRGHIDLTADIVTAGGVS